MAVTPEEAQKVLGMLGALAEKEKEKALSSQRSFETWLKSAAYSIYLKVKNYLSQLWDAISSWFD